MSDENILSIAVYIREIRQALLARTLDRRNIENAILELGRLRDTISVTKPQNPSQKGLISIINALFELTEDDILSHLRAIHPAKPVAIPE